MIRKLVNHFECFTKLSVDIQDIIDAIVKDGGFKEQVNLIPVDINSGIIRGFIHQYTVIGTEVAPYAQSQDVADIYYAKDMPQHWIRLVCCKELMHIFDKDAVVANTKSIVGTLITEVLAPNGLANLSGATHSDHSALVWALALLFPNSAREELLPLYNSGKMNAMDIAKLAEIPARYIPILMSEAWGKFYEELTKEF